MTSLNRTTTHTCNCCLRRVSDYERALEATNVLLREDVVDDREATIGEGEVVVSVSLLELYSGEKPATLVATALRFNHGQFEAYVDKDEAKTLCQCLRGFLAQPSRVPAGALNYRFNATGNLTVMKPPDGEVNLVIGESMWELCAQSVKDLLTAVVALVDENN